MTQFQQSDFRVALLTAAVREIERLKREEDDCLERQILSAAAIKALAAVMRAHGEGQGCVPVLCPV